MEILYFDGDLLTSNATVIMHQVNCQKSMSSGVAKAIKEKWPLVFKEYIDYSKTLPSDLLLGVTQLVPIEEGRYVANLFSQEFYGYKGHKYTSYDAVDKCLKRLAKKCVLDNITSVAMPYKMSSDRGGADWDVILALVKSAFKDTNITIEIWKL